MDGEDDGEGDEEEGVLAILLNEIVFLGFVSNFLEYSYLILSDNLLNLIGWLSLGVWLLLVEWLYVCVFIFE